MKQNQKKLFSVLLLFALLFTMLPTATMADTNTATNNWPSFRGQETNMAITASALPTTSANTTLKWALNLNGYVTPPTLVGDAIYVASESTLYLVDRKTGEIKKSAALQGSYSWYLMPITYGDGMVFAAYDNGQIQAFDAETLESLWVSEQLGGYIASPTTYHNGTLYAANYDWSGDTFFYAALDANDEVQDNGLEQKAFRWSVTSSQAFYWAGSYATDQNVFFGSEGGILYRVDAQDGTILEQVVEGNPIRSSVAYDADTNALYYTNNQGMLMKTTLNTDGSFGATTSVQLSSKSTCTPVVYDGLIFVTSGEPNVIEVWDARDLSLLASAETPEYAQSSVLLSTAHEAEGKLYCYYTCNAMPGGIEVAVYDKTAQTLQTETLFIPEEAMQNYCLCSPICDGDGTIYYINDSGYLMALAQTNADSKPGQGGSESNPPATGNITVSFSLIGDTVHDTAEQHSSYITWINDAGITVDQGSTVYDVFVSEIERYGLAFEEGTSGYISGIRGPEGYWLGELDNGPCSGWMYQVNGIYPDKSATNYELQDGDQIVWRYVDDYTATEENGSNQGTTGAAANTTTKPVTGKEVTAQIAAIGTVNKECGVLLSAIRTAYNNLSDAEKKQVTNYALLVAAEQQYSRLTSPLPFHDVSETHWAYEAIQYLYSQNLMGSTGGDAFAPEASLNRGMLVTILYRMEGSPKAGGSTTFADVSDRDWYSNAVLWASVNGIVSGYGSETFGPNDAITREQMAAMLMRYAQYKQHDTEKANSLTRYADAAEISSWAKNALAWANAEGLMTGRSETHLVPQGTVTRAEVAAILTRYLQTIATEAET